MAIQKKNAKARLDKYYYLAKEKGYRARAAFKLIQLNKKYSFLQQSKCLIDLCAAPGSWLQVAAETMPSKSLIIGVDLSPIKPIPKCITFQDDITSDRCRATIRGHLKGWKADTVIHDGAPNVGTAWVQDAFSQNELVLSSLKLATDFLAPNGNFVTKVFRSKDSAKLEWIFKQLFNKVEQTKPPSSRNVSAETFYVCRGYKAPKHMDPRFLDAKHAFAEVEAAAVNNEARVFNPEKKKRKRDGYEEGDWTQFHEVPASDFIQTQDPIAMLGSLNRLHFRQEGNGDIALAALNKLPETNEEVRLCCEDLKVLGRKEFKLLLRWRLKARDIFGFRQKKPEASQEASTPHGTDKAIVTSDDVATEGMAGEEVAVVESMDDEMRLQEELQHMREMQDKSKRKERRKENEKKQKDIVRMQMNMTTPHDIDMEAGGPGGSDAPFRLKDVDKVDVRKSFVRGRMHTAVMPEESKDEEAEESEEDEEADGLERELDTLYENFQERRENRDAKARAKRIRRETKEQGDEVFEDFDERKEGSDEDLSDDNLVEDDDESLDSDEDDDNALTTTLRPDHLTKNGLSGRAASFFQKDIFKEIDGIDADDLESDTDNEDSGIDVRSISLSPPKTSETVVKAGRKAAKADEAEVEELPEQSDGDEEDDGETAPQDERGSGWQEEDVQSQAGVGHQSIDIITAEAMTLAHALATGKVTKHQLIDDNFNKYSHRDTDGLPDWFLDDEGKHSKPHRPVSKEAAAAIKEKQRALNARPIKKVREAKARKTLRTARRLEKLKKKSEGLAEGSEMSERDKANNIAALMAKAKKGGRRKRPEVKVVRAGGANKGAGRPRGVKGKYKMVDARLKKDVRGEKRLAKKMKGKK